MALTNRNGLKSHFVRDKIKADISSGKYTHQLPGATAMAKELGVNPFADFLNLKEF